MALTKIRKKKSAATTQKKNNIKCENNNTKNKLIKIITKGRVKNQFDGCQDLIRQTPRNQKGIITRTFSGATVTEKAKAK